MTSDARRSDFSESPPLNTTPQKSVPTTLEHDRYPFLSYAGGVDKQLTMLEKYPLLFRAARFPETYPCSLGYWGVQCGPGWYPAIERAAAVIEQQLLRLSQRISDLQTLLNVERLLREKRPGHEEGGVLVDQGVEFLLPFCSQITRDREGLRIVITNGYLSDDEARRIIQHAAKLAVREAIQLCERCGQPGQYQEGYWEGVYCDECSDTDLRMA